MDGDYYHYLTLHRHGTQRSFAIDRPQVLGRSEHVDIHLRDLRVSRLHCRVTPAGEFLKIQDFGAANPTIVNGTPIRQPTLLQVGDWIRVGPYDLRVEIRENWLAEEGGWQRAKLELGRLRRRALARPILVFLVTAAVAGLIGVRTWRKKPEYKASVTFLIDEQRGSDGRMVPPPPPSQLRQYVFDGIFTRGNSLAVMKKFNLFPAKRELDINWAIEEMRDRVDVKTFGNEFLIPDGDELPDRSVRVRITYSGFSPREALVVVRELGSMLRRHEQRARAASAKAAVALVQATIDGLARQIDDLTRVRTRLSMKLANRRTSRSEKAVATMQLKRLLDRIDRLRDQFSAENTKMARTRLISSREQRSMGIRFRLVDWGRMAMPKLKPSFKAMLVGVLVFFFGLPVVGMLVGAFDRRLYRPEDIERLGIASLGQVARYPGHRVGSFAERAAREAEQS